MVIMAESERGNKLFIEVLTIPQIDNTFHSLFLINFQHCMEQNSSVSPLRRVNLTITSLKEIACSCSD